MHFSAGENFRHCNSIPRIRGGIFGKNFLLPLGKRWQTADLFFAGNSLGLSQKSARGNSSKKRQLGQLGRRLGGDAGHHGDRERHGTLQEGIGANRRAAYWRENPAGRCNLHEQPHGETLHLMMPRFIRPTKNRGSKKS